MAHFGDQDAHISVESVKAFEQAHPEVEVHLYAADHGFNCDQRGSYNAGAAATALERSLFHFGKHLARAPPGCVRRDRSAIGQVVVSRASRRRLRLLRSRIEPAADHRKMCACSGVRQRAARSDPVPLGKAAATARGRGVLCDEHRMAAKGRLLAVVPWRGRRQPFGDEARAWSSTAALPFSARYRALLRPEREAAPEGRAWRARRTGRRAGASRSCRRSTIDERDRRCSSPTSLIDRSMR